MSEPRFEMMGGMLVNLAHIESISLDQDPTKIRRSFDEQSQTVKTEVEGDPWWIKVRLYSGRDLLLRYKEQGDRDSRFNNLCRSFGVRE